MIVKKYLLFALLAIFVSTSNAQGIKNYIPDGEYTLNPAVPSPKEFLGFEVGEHHISHDLLISYMRALSKSSDRIIAQEIGTTYEGRPLIFLIITSPENQKNLDKIKERQLMLTDPSRSSSLPFKDMPIVMWFGYSVHGNEASGVNASMAVAYYLAAAQGAQVDKILEQSVIIIQPAKIPDGINMFANWVNSARSYSNVM
ncbi:MAG: M14 family zinc carboxypeptidase, partial [Bacteroidales bacterium]|nr:M14 family zinc carboxypeptidase [Bacteroidales bacterium]